MHIEHLRSDYLPLWKSLEKNLNTEVNNWAVNISPFRIKFVYIRGVKNTSADTISRLICINTVSLQEPEPPGHEFVYYVFKSLPETETQINP